MPSHPEEKRRRLGTNGLVKRPGPLQPGEFERRYYGGVGGAGGCGGGGGTTDGGGGGIIAGTTTTVDTGVAIIAVDSMPWGEWGGRGRRGGGVVGRAIEGVRQLRHRHGRLRRRHRPSPTTDIVAAIN